MHEPVNRFRVRHRITIDRGLDRHAEQDFLAIVGLAPAVLLDDQREYLLDPLIGGEPALAAGALAAAADLPPVLGGPRVDDPVLDAGAEGTAQG